MCVTLLSFHSICHGICDLAISRFIRICLEQHLRQSVAELSEVRPLAVDLHVGFHGVLTGGGSIEKRIASFGLYKLPNPGMCRAISYEHFIARGDTVHKLVQLFSAYRVWSIFAVINK